MKISHISVIFLSFSIMGYGFLLLRPLKLNIEKKKGIQADSREIQFKSHVQSFNKDGELIICVGFSHQNSYLIILSKFPFALPRFSQAFVLLLWCQWLAEPTASQKKKTRSIEDEYHNPGL